MLIKIQDSSENTFHIIDNVTDISYSAEPWYLYSQDELENITNHTGNEKAKYNRLFTREKVDFDQFCYMVNTITFFDDENTCNKAIFDGVAYICNDSGKTVHKFDRAGIQPLPDCRRV